MAGVLVGGAFLSGFINVVLDRLISAEALNTVVGKKLDRQLVQRLQTTLLAAEALVMDAEQKQLGNESISRWLDSLRDAVYTADDLLDTLLTKAATQKEVRNFWPSFLNNEDRDIVNNIERVVRRIEDLEKRKDSLGLEKIPTSSSTWRAPSTSLVRGNVYGREDDKQALIKMLSDNNEHHLSVISIVGIGGVGKTTIAQWLYNNEDLMKGVGLKAWVCVSENFDVVETTKNVLKGILGGTCSLEDFNVLQIELKEKLSKQKFFIVLDDVWSDDGEKWNTFMTPFQYGVEGSVVLLTTREKNVASVVQSCRPYFLNGLSEDYCWSVFANNASFPQSNRNAALEGIGREIVKKCDGLPLAAETLGRLLRTKHDVKEWNKILMSDIWEFSTTNSKVIPALLISYNHLPPYLKRCFVYFSLVPKGYEFGKDELILLWMAEDLLRLPNRGETLEEVGSKCFDDLASTFFFKQLPDDDKHFVMHDLFHDLAMFLAGDFYCRLANLGENEEISNHTRHLCASLPHCSSKLFNSNCRIESLRTLLLYNCSPNFNIETATSHILSKCKYLRVLSFDELDVLPKSIGELIHLRYLDLSWTNIRTLPESLCKLCNLQTLNLYHCSELKILPSGFHNLVNLRHLDIRETSLEEMPEGMSKLKHLHILSYFVVGKHKDNGTQELGGLLNLHGSFEIRKLENVVDAEEAKSARMMDMIHIDELCLEWSSNDDIISSTQTERDILDNLKPHNGLKVMRIKEYKGTIFPNWVGHCSYNNMTSVALESCKNCCMLPSLGQLPSLQSLRIQGFDQLKRIGDEFYKNEDDHSLHIAPFPSLESLEFHNMACWDDWHLSDLEVFPQIKSLIIKYCPMLKGDMLNRVFFNIFSSLAELRKICKLHVTEDYMDRSQEMLLSGETLSITVQKWEVESAFKAMSIHHLACLQLQEMEISQCWSAVSFPGNSLPKSLQILTIRYCRVLKFPQQKQKHDLVELTIVDSCHSLTSLSLDVFPNLKILEISTCPNLESLSLSRPPHAALQRLEVINCNKLEALPNDMNDLFPNLESLSIRGCPKICGLPEYGLLPKLKEFRVGDCKEQLRNLSSMVGNFEALTLLEISGYDCDSVKSYPEVGSLSKLPSLTTLEISLFRNLKTLECNELICLTSLQQLVIRFCEKLKNIAGEKLPSSLLLLKIEDCPLLGKHCKNKHPQIWPKVSHIPTIQVTAIRFYE